MRRRDITLPSRHLTRRRQARFLEWYAKLYYLLAEGWGSAGSGNFLLSMNLMRGYARATINDSEAIALQWQQLSSPSSDDSTIIRQRA